MFICLFVTLRVPPLDSEMSCYYYYCSVTLRVPPGDAELWLQPDNLLRRRFIFKKSFFHCNHHYTATRCTLRNALHTLVPTAMYLGPFQVFFTISPALTNLLNNLVIWTLMTNVYIHL